MSLREAITAINARATLGDPDIAAQNPTSVNAFGTNDTIAFNIAGAGIHTIAVAAPLPSITKTVLLDGYTQSGASPNTLASGDNETVEIVIDGGTTAANGITISGTGANAAGTKVTGTATDPSRNTSEISAPVTAGGLAPVVTMSFSPSAVAPNASSTLTITLTNPNGGAVAGVSFADNYPSGLLSKSAVSNTCGASINANAFGFTFSGGTIPANGACTVTVNLAASSTGVYTNTLTTLLSPSAQPVVAPTATLTISNAVPLFEPAALLLLALALGGVALIVLRR